MTLSNFIILLIWNINPIKKYLTQAKLNDD
jgi:hypothetical protein